MTSFHSNASLCPSATTVTIQYLFPRYLSRLSRRWTHNQTSSATMDKCTYLRKYAFPDPCLFDFLLVLVGTTTSQNIRHFLTHCVLPIALYGYETWFLTLREEHKVLRKIFGTKKVEITGEWRNIHIPKLHALYSSPNIIRSLKLRRMRWVGHVAHMEQSRNAYRVLVGKPEGKRPLGRPRHRWEDNNRMDLREVGCDPGEWIDLAEDRDQWRACIRAVINPRVPY